MGNIARMGVWRNEYRFLMEKSERKRPFGRPRPRREDNIKIYLKAIGLGTCMELICVRKGTDSGRLCLVQGILWVL